MEKELENIFVPYEIAKLSYEKGFREWCCALVTSDDLFMNATKNYEPDFGYTLLSNGLGQFGLPTHFQLIAWLKYNHNIHLSFEKNGKFSVCIPEKLSFRWIVEDDTIEFEINKALEVALNTLPDVT